MSESYELYLQCWYSEQISVREMLERLDKDPDFRNYYDERRLGR